MKHSKIIVTLSAAALLCGAAGWSAIQARATGCPAAQAEQQVTLVAEAAQDTTADTPPAPVSYDAYAPFGLTYDEKTDTLSFEGETVRYFFDGVEFDGCAVSHCEHLDKNGTVDVHTVRTTIDNGDGSVNPFGDLIGLEAYSQAEFDARDLSAPKTECATCEGDGNPDAPSFAARFDVYAPFGLTYVEGDGSGCGNLFLRGKPVRALADLAPDGSTFSYTSRDGGEISVRTVYDAGGQLAGLEVIDA